MNIDQNNCVILPWDAKFEALYCWANNLDLYVAVDFLPIQTLLA